MGGAGGGANCGLHEPRQYARSSFTQHTIHICCKDLFHWVRMLYTQLGNMETNLLLYCIAIQTGISCRLSTVPTSHQYSIETSGPILCGALLLECTPWLALWSPYMSRYIQICNYCKDNMTNSSYIGILVLLTYVYNYVY